MSEADRIVRCLAIRRTSWDFKLKVCLKAILLSLAYCVLIPNHSNLGFAREWAEPC